MEPHNPRHSSAKENWGTPSWIAAAARVVLGGIDLDPASSAEANKIIQARHYFTKSENGLARIWRINQETTGLLSIFLNPPGGKTEDGKSKVKLWWQKMLNQIDGPYFGHGLFLSFSIEAVQVTQIGCEKSLLDFPTCFFARRVDYVDPITQKPVKGNTHSSCITYVPGWQDKTARFYNNFSDFGKIVMPCEDYTDKPEPQRFGEWAGHGIQTNDIGPLP